MNGSRNNLHFDSLLTDEQFRASLKKMLEGVVNFTDSSVKKTSELDQAFTKLSTTIAGVFTVSAAKNFVMEVIRVRGEFQQLEIAFTTMLKSKSAADQLMKEAVRLAATTPFGLQDVANGAKQLIAYGTSAKDVTSTLTMLGNIASGVGAPLNDIVYLYGTLQTQGRAYSKDIQQFTGRGIPIIKELASQFKVAESEVMGLVEAGKVGFPEVQKAFQSMTSSSGMFYNLMAEQSKSLTGQLANLEDAWASMLNEIGTNNQDLLGAGIQGLSTLIDHYEKVVKILGVVIATYGVYRVAVFAVTLSTTGMTAAELLHYGALVIVQKAQAFLNATMLANPYVAIATGVTALAGIMYVLADNTSATEKAQEALNDALKESAKQLEIEKNKLNQLMAVAKNEQISKERRAKAIADINKLSPEYLGNINLENINTQNTTASLDLYTKALEKTIKLKILNQKLEETIAAGMDGPSTFSLIVGDFGKIFGGEDYAKTFAKDNKAAQQIIRDEIKRTLEEESKADSQTVAQKKRSVQVIDEEIKALKDRQSAESDSSKVYKQYQVQIIALEKERRQITGEVAKAEKKQFDQKKAALEAIAKAEADANRTSLSKTEAEIASAKYELNQLRKQVSEAKLGSGVQTRIDRVEQQVIGNITYRSQTENLQEELDRQKQVFSEYEDFKLKTSKSYADERFKAEKGSFETYRDFLKSNIDKVTDQGLALGFDDKIQERLAIYVTELAELNKEDKLKQRELFIDALQAVQTQEEKISSVKKHYQKLTSALEKDATADRKNELIRQQNDEIKLINETALQKTEIYRRVAREIVTYTKESLKEEIAASESLLKNSNLSETTKDQIKKQLELLKTSYSKEIEEGNLNVLQQRQNDLAKLFDQAYRQGLDSAKDFEEKLKQITIQIDKIKNGLGTGIFKFEGGKDVQDALNEIGRNATQIASGFDAWSQALAGSNDELSYTLGQVGQLVGMAGTLAQDLASGDPVQQVMGIVKAAAGLFSMGAKVKKMNTDARAEQQKFYDEAIKGEATYQALLRKRERDRIQNGKNSYNSIISQLELFKKQSKEVSDAYDRIFASLQGQSSVTGVGYEHGTWFRKAKTWDIMGSLAGSDYNRLEQLYSQGKLKDQAKTDFEALKALREELEDAGVDVVSLQNQLNEMLTGTSVSGLADSLSDLFANGKLAAADFAESFEEIMRKSIQNTFQYKVMEDALSPFYDSLSAMLVNGTPGQTQIDALRAQYESISTALAGQFKNLETITGIGLSNGSSSSSKGSLKGSIQRDMTEQTASELVGLYRAQFDVSKRQYDEIVKANGLHINHGELLRQQLSRLANIDVNTRETADNTARLQNMEATLQIIANNTKPSQSNRGLGI